MRRRTSSWNSWSSASQPTQCPHRRPSSLATRYAVGLTPSGTVTGQSWSRRTLPSSWVALPTSMASPWSTSASSRRNSTRASSSSSCGRRTSPQASGGLRTARPSGGARRARHRAAGGQGGADIRDDAAVESGAEFVAVWEPAEARVVVRRDQLQSARSFCGSLLHELEHAASQCRDGTLEFEDALTRRLGTVASAALSVQCPSRHREALRVRLRFPRRAHPSASPLVRVLSASRAARGVGVSSYGLTVRDVIDRTLPPGSSLAAPTLRMNTPSFSAMAGFVPEWRAGNRAPPLLSCARDAPSPRVPSHRSPPPRSPRTTQVIEVEPGTPDARHAAARRLTFQRPTPLPTGTNGGAKELVAGASSSL